jgi:hypothetical protein
MSWDKDLNNKSFGNHTSRTCSVSRSKKIAEIVILLTVLIALTGTCLNVAFRQGGAWDKNMDAVLGVDK